VSASAYISECLSRSLYVCLSVSVCTLVPAHRWHSTSTKSRWRQCRSWLGSRSRS